MSAIDEFKAGIDHNRSGKGGVAASICSAHPLVLRALFRTAKKYDTFGLVESTSNQVDQYGGYTGMKPADFVRLVHEEADKEGFPRERILLGGDHLGPNTWRARPAEAAMAEVDKLVAAYVKAGYQKIHLDASFVCADDKAPLTDEVVSARCARMAKVCEEAAGGAPLVYVIGTEVPTPGGVFGEGEKMHVTTPAEVRRTLDVFRSTFERAGLASAWQRVVGLVVQPGVEFGDGLVHDFEPVAELAKTILGYPGLVYEAHSTDYQTPANLKRLTRDHFYILKVGPWLTYALREALFALDIIDHELGHENPADVRKTLTRVMVDDPRNWEKYYTGTKKEIYQKIGFSYSDRARYYIGRPEVVAAISRLMATFAEGVPEGLLSQYMPVQYERVRSGLVCNRAEDLVIDRISQVVAHYLEAGLA